MGELDKGVSELLEGVRGPSQDPLQASCCPLGGRRKGLSKLPSAFCTRVAQAVNKEMATEALSGFDTDVQRQMIEAGLDASSVFDPGFENAKVFLRSMKPVLTVFFCLLKT